MGDLVTERVIVQIEILFQRNIELYVYQTKQKKYQFAEY